MTDATTCVICGTDLETDECPACHGTGIDMDGNNGSGSRCEWCDGHGKIRTCPHADDAKHQAAYGWNVE